MKELPLVLLKESVLNSPVVGWDYKKCQLCRVLLFLGLLASLLLGS